MKLDLSIWIHQFLGYLGDQFKVMSKSQRMDEIVSSLPEGKYEKEYLGFFACFNNGQFYEAHDVLEHLWLQRRKTQDDLFFKALIQLAGAFVHLQKGKVGPGSRLFLKSRGYFVGFSPYYRGLNVYSLLVLIDSWLKILGKHSSNFSFESFDPPFLNPEDPS